jgi:hypothetical protein
MWDLGRYVIQLGLGDELLSGQRLKPLLMDQCRLMGGPGRIIGIPVIPLVNDRQHIPPFHRHAVIPVFFHDPARHFRHHFQRPPGPGHTGQADFLFEIFRHHFQGDDPDGFVGFLDLAGLLFGQVRFFRRNLPAQRNNDKHHHHGQYDKRDTVPDKAKKGSFNRRPEL